MKATYKSGVTCLPRSLKNRVPADLLEESEFDGGIVPNGGSSRDDAVRAAGPYVKTREQIEKEKERAKEQFRRGRNPRSVQEQPRDYRGRFREVLARLKVNLGESELNEVVSKVEDAQAAEQRNDYGKAADAATDVVQMVDRLESGSLDPDQIKNIKETTKELGKAIAYLPLPQGDPNATLRFSDLPPTTQELLQNMKKRVLEKLAPDKARELLMELERFTSGQIQVTSDQLQSILAKLLTYLID